MYTAMKSIFEDKNKQEDLFFKGPGNDLEVIQRLLSLLRQPFVSLELTVHAEQQASTRAFSVCVISRFFFVFGFFPF